MAKHAILSASGASRWLACTPSARLEQQFENTSSEYAAEGTLAHELGEISLQKELGLITTRKYNTELKKIQSDELYTADMPDYIDVYINTCMEKVAEAKAKTPDAICRIEQRLDFSRWVPEGFGTGDFVIIADGTMEICDLKYGKGVPVSAEGNKQMRLYALGAVNEFEFLYDIQKVKMTIIQPRLDSISTDELSIEELLSWAENKLKPRAELAFKGEGEFCPGDHCRFCRAKAVCRARAEKNLELAKEEFKDPATLENEEIADILKQTDELINWANDIKEYALDNALKGEVFPGWKVVEGRSIRKISDTEAALKALVDAGYQDTDVLNIKIKGITDLEKIVGKKKLKNVIGKYIVKPQGKPTLVPESDKRPIYNTAQADFEEVIEE